MAFLHFLIICLLIKWSIACKSAPEPPPKRLEIEHDKECVPGRRPTWIGVPHIRTSAKWEEKGYVYVDWRGKVKNKECVARYYIKVDSITDRRSLLYYETAALRRHDPYYEMELRHETIQSLSRVTGDIEVRMVFIL